MRVGLLRHGRTEWNNDGKLQGQTDIPLTEDAIAELSTLALPDAWRHARLVASTLSRAKDTARIVAEREPLTDERLREMGFGVWEGLRGEDLRNDPASGFRDIPEWGWDYRPHGGESPRDLYVRTLAAIEDQVRAPQPTLIVSHLVVMRVIMARAHEWDFLGPAPFKIKRNRIYELDYLGDDDWRMAAAEPVRLVERAP